MRIFSVLFVLSLLMASGLAASAQDRPAAFDRLSHDFGTLGRGESRDTVFTLVNRSEAPLLLTDVSTSCRCLRLQWSRRPLAPGESAVIAVTYRSRDRGTFYREIVVRTNASPKPYLLYVKGIVE